MLDPNRLSAKRLGCDAASLDLSGDCGGSLMRIWMFDRDCDLVSGDLEFPGEVDLVGDSLSSPVEDERSRVLRLVGENMNVFLIGGDQ